ncbi:MAG TPA: glycosyltransferase family 2 protein [Burkholderiales bacterium]|nr:glycosyltransferase family 2 protein [Burkholderiales bacterium]
MNPVRPKVSIVLPTYNHLRFLPRAVACALDQTLMDFELIIVNDGSTDDTRAWLDNLQHPNVRIFHQQNRGFVAAVNFGIQQSRGEYLSWMSADNRCARYFVEAFVAALDSDASNALAYSPFFSIDADDRVTGVKFDNLLLLRELVTNRPRGMAGFMYRKSVHDAIGMYQGGAACDTLMWSRMIEKFSAVFVMEPTYYFRFHENRETLSRGPKEQAEIDRITASFLESHDGARSTEDASLLYPGIGNARHLAAYAKSDFACRLSKCGFKADALALLGSVLEAAASDEMLRPLINTVGLCLLSDVEPVSFVSEALAKNAKLSAEATDACIDVVNAIAELMKAGGSVELLSIEASSRLLALEKPKVFSFLAWKENSSHLPVRGI